MATGADYMPGAASENTMVRTLLLVPLLLAAVACELTVSEDADCEAWLDTCGGCTPMCTPKWDVPEQSCDIACETNVSELPACVAEAGTCVFTE